MGFSFTDPKWSQSPLQGTLLEPGLPHRITQAPRPGQTILPVFSSDKFSKRKHVAENLATEICQGKGDQFKANVSQHNIKSSHQKNDGSGRWSFPFETVFFQGHSLGWISDHKTCISLKLNCVFLIKVSQHKFQSEWVNVHLFFRESEKTKATISGGPKKSGGPKPPIFAECLLQPTQIQIILQKFTAKFWPSCCARETAPSTFHKTQGISNVFQPKKGFNITKPSQNHRETKVFHISCGQIFAPFTWPTFHWIHYPWHPSHMHLAGGLLCRNLGSLASFCVLSWLQ